MTTGGLLVAVLLMVPLADRISRAGGSDNSGGNGGGSAVRYGSGGRPVGRSVWLVQVAAVDGCARVRAYDGMRGKLGLGALQRGIGDSAMSERVARYRPIHDAIFNRQHTLLLSAPDRTTRAATRTTEENGAYALTPAARRWNRRILLVHDRNFSANVHHATTKRNAFGWMERWEGDSVCLGWFQATVST